jgi:hypothetical protein
MARSLYLHLLLTHTLCESVCSGAQIQGRCFKDLHLPTLAWLSGWDLSFATYLPHNSAPVYR